MTEVELKLELFDLLEEQDKVQLEYNAIAKLKDEKVELIAKARKAENKEEEKNIKLEVFDLLEQLDILKFKFAELDKNKVDRYQKLTDIRKKKDS